MKKKSNKEAERMIHIRLDLLTHKKLRMKAASADQSIQELVLDILKKALRKY
jgi:hypothetical protein